VLALISSVFSEAVRAELFVGLNPCRGVRRNKENKRSRFLTREELPNLFSALEECKNPVARDYIKMSLITGARRSNVLAMRWDQINFVRNEWLIPDTKMESPRPFHCYPKHLKFSKPAGLIPLQLAASSCFRALEQRVT